jgi:hypothetical protein
MLVASRAFIDMAGLQQPAFLVTTTSATETIRPPQFNKGLKTMLFIRKMLLPLPKTRDFCLHDGSPGHQAKTWIWQTCGKFIAMKII